MRHRSRHLLSTALLAGVALAGCATTSTVESPETPSTQALLESSTAADWRTPDPQNLLYMDLDAGRVIIELAPAFASTELPGARLHAPARPARLAACPEGAPMITGKADPADRSDDIAQLRQHLDMPDLNYQDISLLVGVQQALQRWPLLGESCRSSAQGTLYTAAPRRQVLSP